MRQTVIAISCAAVAFGGLPGTAWASPPEAASCVGVITSHEASQLSPGSVGREVSGLGTSGAGLGRTVVSPLARERGADCA
jgi:hypothetical protein